ncbi:MAG: hypothetical protein ACK5NE_09040 [Brachymonas sp.]
MTTQENSRATTGASAAVSDNGIHLSETVASDLPYTKDGLLDMGHMLRNAGSFGESDWRLNRIRKTVYGASAAVDVLQLEDDALVGMSASARCGLLCAVSVLLETLSMDVQNICEQQRKAKGGEA